MMDSTAQHKDNEQAPKHAGGAVPETQVQADNESGAEAGMPLFMKHGQAAISGAPPPTVQRQVEDGEEEEELFQPSLLGAPSVQPKLRVGPPDDEYEREADRVADAVMNGSQGENPEPGQASIQSTTGSPQYLQRLCAECEEGLEPQSTIRAKHKDSGAASVPGEVSRVVDSPSGGKPLSPDIHSQVGNVLGSDLSHVRVHSDAQAQEAARTINAKAFTHDNHIWLGRGESEHDLSLMAHEATHVVQQASPIIRRELAETIQRTPEDEIAGSSADPQSAEPYCSMDTEQSSNICTPEDNGGAQRAHEPEVYDSYNSALNSGMTRVQQVSSTMEFLRDTILPGFKAARDAADSTATTELAAVIVQSVGNMRTALDTVTTIVTDYDPTDTVSSSTEVSVSLMQGDEMDFALHSDLVVDLDLAIEDLENFERMLLVAMGPQEFRDRAVAGSYMIPGYDDRLQAIVREASFTIDILITANAMKERVLAADNYREYQAVVSMAEMWRSRPINFYFLYHILSVLLGSTFNFLVRIPGMSGRNLMQMRGDVQDIGRTFGVMTDVGTYNEDVISNLLTYSLGDWAITDENAKAAFEMIAGASPAARLPILERLHEQGLLARLCNNLPGQYVQALLDDIGGARGIDAPPVAFVLQNCINENTGGGETVSEIYEANIMENLAEDNYVRAYLWTLLDVSHSATTFGFKDIHDQAYQARREGLISSDAYWSTTAKAAGRSAALLAATAVSGGTAGGFAEGFALARGAGATTASLIGAGVGGGAAGFTGQLTGDVYDQALLGKEGFSSFGDYARSTAFGVGSGVLVAGVGVASARYLPGGAASAQRMFEYHSGSPAGRYSFAQGPRQALHGGLYSMYRNASMYGRNVGRSTGLPPEQYQEYFEFGSEQGRHHVFEGDLSVNPNSGELRGSGGHLWPSNRAGGPSAAGSGPSGPKSAFPRSWNQERIMEIVAETYTDPAQPWLQQEGPGQGAVHTGLPENIRTNAGNPVRFRADRVVDGVTVRVVWQPGGRELITAFPVGAGDTANLLMTVPPYASFTEESPGYDVE